MKMKIPFMFALFALSVMSFGAQAQAGQHTTKLSKLLNAGEWRTRISMTMDTSDRNTSISPMNMTTKKCYKKKDLYKLLTPLKLNLPKLSDCKR